MEYRKTETNGVIEIKAFENEASTYPKAAVTLSGDASNCKLSYIHRAGNLVGLTKEQKKEFIDFALTNLKGCVILNTTQEKVADFISETYPVYYYHKVPIGYNGKFQYHICIQNIVKPNASCRKPLPPEAEQPLKALVPARAKVKTGYSKTKIEKSLRAFTKGKDVPVKFVTNFIEELTK